MLNPLLFFLLLGIQAMLGPYEPKNWDTLAAEGCCNIRSVGYYTQQQPLHIPSVFTPNGDGFNDRFIPRSDDKTLLIRDFMIASAQGDTLLFYRERIDYADPRSLRTGAWNGLRPDGSLYQGRFTYRMTIGDQSAANPQLTGEACALRCRSGGRVVQSKTGCFYAD
ncbi:hypothetical protein [Spirosoma endophyticum]|uniref:Gliding motility-associated C-terminal domain-containing protein n=1 Tax=Spirosoma endophyticum TaxID=662367 RepID=A0A1I1ZNU7_9BACT|nr:hypothetical protein [Spirosoma endophyticum]SFE33494.1 hypothetical protein SAMN05216167_112179 [Spirosoma endophyticum]